MNAAGTARWEPETDRRDLLLVFSVCPLLAVSDTMSNAIGLAVAVTIVVIVARCITLLASRLFDDQWQIAATLMIITAIASAVQLLMQAQFPLLFRSLGIFPLLLATNVTVVLRFGSREQPVIHELIDTAKLCVQIAVLLIVLGIARELVGRGSVFHDAGNQFGDWARSLQLFRADMGFLLAMLPPGAFISLGLMLAVRNWFAARSLSE